MRAQMNLTWTRFGRRESKSTVIWVLAQPLKACRILLTAGRPRPLHHSGGENGYSKEEMKVVWETRKIFGLPELAVSCTAVRIPTFRAHAEAITLETERPVDLAAARAAITAAPGVELVDEPAELRYPMPMNATEKYDVECGRMRKSLVFGDNGLDLFVCGDQILRGAALNAVLIAEAACVKK